MYIIISKACIDCGGEISVMVIDDITYNFDELVRQNEEKLGGMYCINSAWKELDEDDCAIIEF
jgi:hypothetical protein